jgi:plastocyanin
VKNLAVLGGIVVLVAAFLVVCTGGGGDDDDGEDEAAAVVDAEMNLFGPRGTDYGFEPNTLTLTAGQEFTLRLINTGTQAHRFRIQDPEDRSIVVVDSDVIAVGESKVVRFTLSEAGTVAFFCPIYGPQAMSGEITVE